MPIDLDLSDMPLSTSPPDVWGAKLKAHLADLASGAYTEDDVAAAITAALTDFTAPAAVSVTGTTTIPVGQPLTIVNSASGANTQTLPDATVCSGQVFTIIKTSADPNLVTLAPHAGQTVGGAAQAGLLKQGHRFVLASDGTATWRIVHQPRILSSVTPDYTLLAPLTTTSTTMTPMDPANLSATFVCPPSGKVKVRKSISAWTSTGSAEVAFGDYDVGTSATVLHTDNAITNSTGFDRGHIEYEVSELAVGVKLIPGNVYTWQAGWHLQAAGTASMDNALELYEIEAVEQSDTGRVGQITSAQNPASNSTATASAAVTIAKPTAGNLLIAWVQANVTSAGNWSISSAGGGTWNKLTTDQAVNGVSRRNGLYWKVAASGDTAGAVTFTATGSTATALHVTEFAGFTGTPTVDRQVGGSLAAAGTAVEVDDTVAIATAPEFMVVSWGVASAQTVTGKNPPNIFADTGTMTGCAGAIQAVGIPRIKGILSSSVASCGILATFTGV